MKRPRISRRKFLSGLVIASTTTAIDAFGLEPQNIKLRSFRLSDRPAHRFVHITDIHHKGNVAFLQQVIQMVNAATPEFVCFTGDLVEEAEHIEEALETLSGVKAPIYGIPGNHDSGRDLILIWRKWPLPAPAARG